MERRVVFFSQPNCKDRSAFTQDNSEQTQVLGQCFALQEPERAVGASPLWGLTQSCSVMTSWEDLHASLPPAIQQFDNRWACNYSPFERFFNALIWKTLIFLPRKENNREKRKHLNLTTIPAASLFTAYSAGKVETLGFSQPNCECNWIEQLSPS